MTSKAKFSQADITRMLKAMIACNLDPAELHIDTNTGKVTVYVRGYEPSRTR